MRTYESKEALIEAIQIASQKYLAEFAEIPETLKDHRIDSLSEDELFLPQQRAWATTKAQWPLWKWIHINSVAPFTSFRTQIRKWKKACL